MPSGQSTSHLLSGYGGRLRFARAAVHVLFIACVVRSLGLLAQPVGAEISITGRITTSEGTPIQAAVLILIRQSSVLPASKYRVTTDTEGRFRLALPPGRYNISLQSLGFETIRCDDVELGRTSAMNIQLNRGSGTRVVNSEDLHIHSGSRAIPPPPAEGPPEMAAPPPPTPVPTQPTERGETPDLPRFPFPPPVASATEVLPARAFRAPTRLADVDQSLTAALDANGYTEKSYYGVPEGFALVTRMERMLADGRSSPMPGRWSTNSTGVRPLDISQYLRALFTADPGYYRVIVFVVTPVAFTENASQHLTSAQAQQWLVGGLNILPEQLGALPFTAHTKCTILIYEFEKPQGSPARILVPESLGARGHLVRSGLWSRLVPP